MNPKILRNRFLLLLPVLIAVLATSASAAVIRVKWDSPTNGPGSTWSNAYNTVTAAIAASTSNDEIWVAGNNANPYIENITLKAGVGLYGGFAGTETTRTQRNWNTNVTILNGNGADLVVTAPSGATTTTVLDGFEITGAFTGINCTSSSPSITNNIISGNDVDGIYCETSSPKITNNTISGNLQSGIYCLSGSPTITNNNISGNQSGISCDSVAASPSITNNIISENTYEGIFCY
ncbi:MAG: right-handed parallel beta-helix repeat-containing protein, partial [Armatimonadota bacterium]